MDSSGGSSESDPLGVDFWGEPVLLKDLVFRSRRPERLEDVDDCCDCD